MNDKSQATSNGQTTRPGVGPFDIPFRDRASSWFLRFAQDRLLVVGQLSRLRPRRETVYLTRALAEACLLTPWLTAFAKFYRPDVSMLDVASVTFFVILGASYLVRAMGALGLGVRAQRAIVLGIVLALSAWGLHSLELASRRWPDLRWLLSTAQSLINLGTLIPASLSIVLVAVFLLWRGLRLAQKPLSVFDVRIGFQIGIVLFAVFLLLSSPEAEVEVNPFIVAFFFCQLLAIGLTRVETISDQPGGRRSQFGGWWLAALTTSTGTAMAIAGIILVTLGIIGQDRILTWLQPFLAIVLIPLSIAIIPLLALVGMVLEWLANAIDLSGWLQQIDNLRSPLDPRSLIPTPEPGPRSPIVEIALQVASYTKALVVLAVVVLIIIGVLWGTGRLQSRRKGAEDEEHESVWSAGQWAARLRRHLDRQLKRIANAAGLLTRFGAGRFFTAMTIRRIYAQLQNLAAKQGYPREPACTPYEYLPTLNECFPGYQADIAQLTEAYVGVHYGELPEHPEELAAIRATWERIRESSISAASQRSAAT